MHKYTDLANELGFDSPPEIYGTEGELAVPRPIPGGNIKNTINPQKVSIKNVEFKKSLCIRYVFDSLGKFYEKLKSEDCFQK